MNKEIISLSINTPRLLLINSTIPILETAITGKDHLAALLDITIPDHWSEFGDAPFIYALEKVKANPGSDMWWSWLPLLKAENRLIGNGGYKGPPQDGIVEIGYEVALAYRQQGYATEIALALVENAFTHADVHTVIAHTLPEENASVRVLRRCGFTFAGEVMDPEDGLIWTWKKKVSS